MRINENNQTIDQQLSKQQQMTSSPNPIIDAVGGKAILSGPDRTLDLLASLPMNLRQPLLDHQVKQMQQQTQQIYINPIQMHNNPIQMQINPIQMHVNPIQMQINPIQMQVNPIQMLSNPMQIQQSSQIPLQSTQPILNFKHQMQPNYAPHPQQNVYGINPLSAMMSFPSTDTNGIVRSSVHSQFSALDGYISSSTQALQGNKRKRHSVPETNNNTGSLKYIQNNSESLRSQQPLQLGESSDEEEDEEIAQNTKSLSRHVTSVLTHFTSTPEAYERLLNEIDDYLHVLSVDGILLYSSPAVKKFLEYSCDELKNTAIAEIIHVDDRDVLLRQCTSSIQANTEYVCYCRYKKKSGDYILFEVKGKPHATFVDGEQITYILQSAREYKTKCALTIDTILELRIENLRLRRQLELLLIDLGTDPATHPLLVENIDISSFQMMEPQHQNDRDMFALSADLNSLSYGIQPSLFTPPAVQEKVTTVEVSTDIISGPALKKKRGKQNQEDLFCRQCGTTNSPEWRRGPSGPKTLCNACGLAFSKKTKRLSNTVA